MVKILVERKMIAVSLLKFQTISKTICKVVAAVQVFCTGERFEVLENCSVLKKSPGKVWNFTSTDLYKPYCCYCNKFVKNLLNPQKLSKGRSAASVMFTFLHVLLKTSNHVALLTPHARMSPDQEQQSRKLCDIAFKEHKEFLGLTREAAFRTLSDPQYCGKMKVMLFFFVAYLFGLFYVILDFETYYFSFAICLSKDPLALLHCAGSDIQQVCY